MSERLGSIAVLVFLVAVGAADLFPFAPVSSAETVRDGRAAVTAPTPADAAAPRSDEALLASLRWVGPRTPRTPRVEGPPQRLVSAESVVPAAGAAPSAPSIQARVVVPTPTPAPRTVLPPPPAPAGDGTTASGVASWYCCSGGFAGQAVVALPAVYGGRYTGGVVGYVTVCADRCARLPVVDQCGCHWGTAQQRVVDLSPEAWAAVTDSSLGRGLVPVTITLG